MNQDIDITSFRCYNVFNGDNCGGLMNTRVTGGEQVQILTSGGEVDPNIYVIEHVGRDLVGLTCRETGITIKVNSQRIHKIIKEKNMNDTDTATIEETTIDLAPETTTATTEKPKKEKTPKAPPAPIDWDRLVSDGYEVWTKEGLTLGTDPKVSEIQVAAHCVIDPEGTENRGYEVFNSYNGTRGAKGKSGKHYPFTEKNTIEKKRKTLAKKGYTQYT